MNTEGTVINKYAIKNPELCEINNILINKVNKYDKRGLNFRKLYVYGD